MKTADRKPAEWLVSPWRANSTPGPTPTRRVSAFFRLVRAWMVVVPIDLFLLLTPVLWNPEQAKATTAMAALSLLLLTGGGRYRARLHLSILDELPSLLARLLAAAGIIATITALRHDQDDVTTFLVNVAVTIGLVVLGRFFSTALIAWSRARRITQHRTVLIGGGALAAEMTQILARYPRYGLTVVGFVDEGSGCVTELVTTKLGALEDLDAAIVSTGADVILIADGDFSERRLLDVVRSRVCAPCDLLVVPRMHHFATQTGSGDHVGSIPVVRIRTPNLQGPTWALKRAFDILFASAALLLAAPFLAVCAVLIRWEGGPGVIFRQRRVGRDGATFDCFKLRSMRPVDDRESATNWSVANDRRVGPFGRFLRRTSVDELPQMWNILKGDMTLVGPRPERPHFVSKFSAEFDRYTHRHRVRAGLTGLAQVSGLRGDTSIADRARFDNYYIEHWSLWLDIKIIIRTLLEIFLARGR